MRNLFRRKPVDPVDEKYQIAYPGISKERRRQYRREDEAFASFARATLDAASGGVDMSFLDGCPDLTRLALDYQRGRTNC